MFEGRSLCYLTAVLLYPLVAPAVAADCNNNGVEDALDVMPSFNLADPVNFTTADQPVGIAAADLDKDGDLDLITANEGSNLVSVLLNDGMASFGAATDHAVADGPVAVVAADFDGDTFLDLATPGILSGKVSVLHNQGDGTFDPAVDIDNVGDALAFIAAADFDKQNGIDLAVTDSAGAGNEVGVLFNDGAGNFAAPVTYAVGMSPRGLVAADFDGGGDIDLACPNHLRAGDERAAERTGRSRQF